MKNVLAEPSGELKSVNQHEPPIASTAYSTPYDWPTSSTPLEWVGTRPGRW